MILRTPKHDRLNTAPDETAGTPDGMLSRSGRPSFLPPDLILEPISRRPTLLPETTVRAVQDLPAGAGRAAGALTPAPFDPAARNLEGVRGADSGDFVGCSLSTRVEAGPAPRCSQSTLPITRGGPSDARLFPRVSIVVITRDNLVFSKLCLESVIANTDYPDYELIVVDNGSGEELLPYLDQLTDRFPFIRVVRNETNRGFAAANNQGLAQRDGRPIRPPQ